MSTAANRNFAIAQRERDRRIARGLDDPYDTTAQGGDPASDAFFGSLRDLSDAAAQRGMGFRADLSGIGRFDEPMQGGPSQNEQNIRLGQLTDANAVRQLMRNQADYQQMDDIVNSLKASDQDRLVAQAFQAPERASVTTETGDRSAPTPQQTAFGVARPTVGEGQSFSIRNTGPESARERALALLPAPLKAAYQAQLAAQDLAEAKQTEVERHNKATEEAAAASLLPDDAIDDAATQYNKTGVMPVLGMKDPGNRQRILARAAQKAREGGGEGADIAFNKAGYKADSASLTKLQGQRDAVGAFEGTALKNLDVFLDAAKQIPDTKSPMLNKPIRAIDEKALGSPELTAYNVARTTVIPEFAKILSNPGLSGQLTDSARHEIENVLSGDATLAQTLAAVNVLKKDAENRRTEFDRQIEEVKGRMKDGGKSGAPNTVAAPPPSANPFRNK